LTTRRVEPLPGTVYEHLAAVLPEGLALAGVGVDASPLEAATAVDAAIRQQHEDRKELSESQIAGLGVVWGKAVSQATGWTWAGIADGETNHVCLVAQDHAHACSPIAFIKEQIEGTSASTALVLFNLIASGTLPKAALEELLFVG